MFSAPGMSAAHGHAVVDRSISSGTATSHAHDTLLPWRTARAAASRTSSVRWFNVPSWSSSPHRPQFDSVSKYLRTSSCVGIGRPAVIAASTPPVPRFEARYNSSDGEITPSGPRCRRRVEEREFPTVRSLEERHVLLEQLAGDRGGRPFVAPVAGVEAAAELV